VFTEDAEKMQKIDIKYLTHMWNPISMLCTPVSAGCEHCWHLRAAHRMKNNPKLRQEARDAYAGGAPWMNISELSAPLRRKKPALIGVQFMGDLFHESISNEQIAAVFGVMAACHQHTFFVLTKRTDDALSVFEDMYGLENFEVTVAREAEHYGTIWDSRGDNRWLYTRNPHNIGRRRPWEWPLPNVIFCVTVENNDIDNAYRIDDLLQIPAAKRIISVEPMLDRVDLEEWLFCDRCRDRPNGWRGTYDDDADWDCGGKGWKQCGCSVIDGVICGAETGPGKRPFKNKWALDLRDQCKDAGVPFFFKRDGDGFPTLCGVQHREWPEGI